MMLNRPICWEWLHAAAESCCHRWVTHRPPNAPTHVMVPYYSWCNTSLHHIYYDITDQHHIQLLLNDAPSSSSSNISICFKSVIQLLGATVMNPPTSRSPWQRYTRPTHPPPVLTSPAGAAVVLPRHQTNFSSAWLSVHDAATMSHHHSGIQGDRYHCTTTTGTYRCPVPTDNTNSSWSCSGHCNATPDKLLPWSKLMFAKLKLFQTRRTVKLHHCINELLPGEVSFHYLQKY